MTTIHTIRTSDDSEYQIELPAPLDALSDDQALGLMVSSLTTLAAAVHEDSLRIANSDYSDDDTDYMPARAAALSALTSALLSDFDPAEALRHLLADDDFILDCLTLSADTLISINIDYI